MFSDILLLSTQVFLFCFVFNQMSLGEGLHWQSLMSISHQKIFFWDQNDLGIGEFIVLDPLSNCGRAYLECPRRIPSVELGETWQQGMIMDRWWLLICWRQNSDSAGELWFGAGSDSIQPSYIRSLQQPWLPFIEALRARLCAKYFDMAGLVQSSLQVATHGCKVLQLVKLSYW